MHNPVSTPKAALNSILYSFVLNKSTLFAFRFIFGEPSKGIIQVSLPNLTVFFACNFLLTFE